MKLAEATEQEITSSRIVADVAFPALSVWVADVRIGLRYTGVMLKDNGCSPSRIRGRIYAPVQSVCPQRESTGSEFRNMLTREDQ